MRKWLSLLCVSVVASVVCFAQDVTPSPAPTTSASPAKYHRRRAAAATQMAPTPAPTVAVSPIRGPTSSQVSTPVTGGGNGQVWVNTSTHVYHREVSRFYGKTKHGKYMSEQAAIAEGDHAAKNEH